MLVSVFNASAKTARVDVYVLKGRIAESDSEAARAISGELRELLDTMKTGITDADVTAIRDAANKAKKLGGMLDAETGRKVSAAIEEARSVAREIVKRVVADSDSVTDFVLTVNLEALHQARFAFLDLDGPAETGEALPVVETRGLDLESEAASPAEDAMVDRTTRLDLEEQPNDSNEPTYLNTKDAASFKGPELEV